MFCRLATSPPSQSELVSDEIGAFTLENKSGEDSLQAHGKKDQTCFLEPMWQGQGKAKSEKEAVQPDEQLP